MDSASQDVFSLASGAQRTQQAVRDAAARPGTYPLIAYSHGNGNGARRMATFLCTHLSSHGYVVAALDHFEVVAREFAPKPGETDPQKSNRAGALMDHRLADIGFLIDRLDTGTPWNPAVRVDASRVGIVGHSFGGWTALAATDNEPRIAAVVAMAPAGSSRPKPGILPAKLSFSWHRDVPTLYLVAENDVMTPLDGMVELYERTPATKRMLVLRRADHLHFVDQVETEHEAARNLEWTGVLSWISKEMRPIAELCSGEQAHRFVCGLALGHMDAMLRQRPEAQRFLSGDVQAELERRGVDAMVYRSAQAAGPR